MKFRRQYAFGPYVLDFYCPAHQLAIEVDGSSHFTDQGIAADAERRMYLEKRGVHVLRFTNVEVLSEPASVLEVVLRFAADL
jgi:very-short-patch-repair endonuclease